MAHQTRLFLFGDQTHDFVPKLNELLGFKDNLILQAFLEQSHYVIRAQMIQSLPFQEHKISRSSSLASMVQKYADGKLNSAFQTALSCICQLGSFIHQFEDPAKSYPTLNDSYVLGVCTGSLAAAAISSSSSLSDLLPLAVQTVLVAFRLGLRALELRDRLELSVEHRDQPWSAVVAGLAPKVAAEAIREFCAENVLPRTNQPWITGASTKTTTLSGSPRILAKLLATPLLASLKSTSIPISVPSHNDQLFTPQDVDAILESTADKPWSDFTARLPYLSSVSGKLAWGSHYRVLVEMALNQCLLEPIGWDKVETELPRLLKSRDVDNVQILGFSSSAFNKSLSAALTSNGIAAEIGTGLGTSARFSHRPGSDKCKLAIVSMSGRFPESQTTDAFWDLLYKGVDACKEVPRRRWDVATHVDPNGRARNKGATKWGCWLDFFAEFDPKFFSISPKEAPQMDPAQRMALMSTYEAMERAGLVADTTSSTQRNRIGVFHGVTSNDWMETNTAQNIDTYFITGGNRGFIPGRINFCFEFSGPSFTNDTACSSSLAAIHLACNSLWRGDCDTAVAGGTNMIFTPDGHTGLDKGFFLSRTGNCKPFDDNADGYCRAEGVGTVFIKRLEDALADNDPILATILDIKTNHSAMSESMTRPHAGAQIDNMSAALASAGIHPNDLSYIEMHGTGTQVGDATEMESVLSVFAPDEAARRNQQPLYVGSAKGNVGHGEGVSGVTSLIKILLMMQNETIVPHVGIKAGSKINHNYPDLPARNVHVAFEPTAWPRNSKTPRRVLINNFSAAGGNTALLIEDAPERAQPKALDPRSSHIVSVSAHVGKSLKGNMENLLAFLEKSPDASLANLSYTTTARRWHHMHRASVVGSSIEDIKRKLKVAIDNGDGVNRPKSKPKVLFAFTGQGSQYIGMGRKLYEAYPKFRSDLQHFDQLARSQGFPSFAHIYETTQGSIEDSLPIVSQLATTCLEMALHGLLISFGIKPTAVIGHSLGEYAALYAAGVVSASDTIYLVGKRAELLQERCQRGTHAMLATRASASDLMKLLPETKCEVACVNGPHDTVLSGSVKDITEAQRIVAANGIKGTLLKLPFAFHSAQVQPILEDMETLASGVPFGKPTIPVFSPLLGKPITEAGVIDPLYLARHCREAVDFVRALENAKESGMIDDKTIVVELGPKPLLCGMVKMTLGSSMKAMPTLAQNADIWLNLQNILAAIYTSGLEVDWVAYHSPFGSSLKVLQLPTYAWDLKEYWIPYEGDWCLHRHKIECSCATPGKEKSTSEYKVPKDPAAPIKRTSKLDSTKEAYPEVKKTTTVHRVVEEKTEPLGATFVVETDICREDVSGLAQGHVVDGIPLVTPSFYADIALQIGTYTMNRLRASHSGAMDGIVDVSDLVVDKALIPRGQLLRATLTMQWPPKAAATTRSAKIIFASYFADGKLDTEHATCTVRFTSDAQRRSLNKKTQEYRARINRLREGMKQGRFVRYTRKSGYKLMSNMAHFHPDYKLLDDLVLDEGGDEAVSMMDFSAAQTDGTFAAHPAYVDAITQVAGFALNANDNTDIEKEVFVNHGWESFQIYEPLTKNKVYEVYTKMERPKTGDLVHGDIIVLHEENVVAFFKGISLRSVPRKALRAVLQAAQDKGIRQCGGKPAPKSITKQNAKAPPVTTSAKPTPAATETSAPVHTEHRLPKSTLASATSNATHIPKVDDAKFQAALKVIAEESGVAIEELTDESNFTDMGIDSLSSMVIGSRLREDLGMDLSPDFSLFTDCATVQDLRCFMNASAPLEAAIPAPSPAPTASVPTVLVESDIETMDSSTTNVPDSLPGVQIGLLDIIQKPEAMGHQYTAALQIIAEESGVAVEDLTEDTIFSEIGIDSLSSMVISSRFREDLGLGLDSTFSFFDNCPSVSKLREFISGSTGICTPAGSATEFESSGSACLDTDSSSVSDLSDNEEESTMVLNRVSECRPCTSVILQGLPRVAAKTLFMLPDGGGSASSYVPIPRLRSDVAVVGLNCPYARDPENMICTHQAMIGAFCNEIRRRQPHGPYHLGGWSSGGAFAYVVAEALVNSGEEVRSIIIVDAPVPQVMEKLPVSFYQHCNTIGLFANQPGGAAGNADPPPYLIPHFQAVVDVMLDYKVAPLKTGRMPKVGLLWAADTVLDEGNAPKIKGMHFMVQKRTDFGPDGWETVMPGAQFDIVKATGANHFTLMSKEHVHLISDLIDRIMG
ncbi:putative Polyketide synthase [Seiridium cardinale]